jgi:hypothetical protein
MKGLEIPNFFHPLSPDKPAPQVTFEDVQRLVSSKVPESQTLEYKSGRINLARLVDNSSVMDLDVFAANFGTVGCP